MIDEGILINPRLESKIRESLNYKGKNLTKRCYEASRKLSRQSTQFGYSEITVRDGLAIYHLDLLINLVSNKERSKNLKNIMNQSKPKYSHLMIDHSWGEMLDERIRIDFIPYIKLPEGLFNFDLMFMTNMDVHNENAEYFPIGKEFSILNSKYVYNPSCGPKIGPFNLPKIIKLENE